ncbi:YfhO family protein [Levilactobacillus tujiorum]|uniref:YfhO family protein n=1 Tax=Levilactobacillus tujiorum TaxID=2912243 RepID=A0ABX1L4D3_9LACO|nr:YfhO family protein [Levilactobacillus tujiorum]MCH5464076.1 YfhO family protein [Levilactobacillus tujiorum]NLR11177.1 YfhO family protein [Lactobacillus sp. HBUAS51387]NLR29196.1 YfhO family protein [Levilactobacillus tujiorum]
MKIKSHRIPVWVLYSLCFAVLATLSFGVLHLAGRTFIWDMDGIAQHYPIMHEFQRLLHQGGISNLAGWSWTYGIGADKLTTLAYYVLGDPFAYVLALLPNRLLEAGFGWMVIARLYASGLAFLALAHNNHFRPGSQLLGAVTYVFSGYALMIGYHHPFFLLPMISFPLLLVGINRILQGRSWTLLGVMTGLTILSNFYFAYVLGLGCLIYIVIRYVHCRQEGTLKIRPLQVISRSLLAALGGLLLSGVLLVPSALMMLNSTRTGGVFANGLKLYPLSYYLKLGNSILTTGDPLNYWVILGLSGLTFLGCVYVLVHWRDYRYLAGTLVAIGLGLLIPAVAAVFNVFSTPSNRWLLLAAVPFSLATMILFDHLRALTVRDGWWLGGSALGLLVLVYVGNGLIFNNPPRNFVTYGFLLVTTLLLVASVGVQSRWLLRVLCVVVGLNVIGNAWGYYNVNAGGRAAQQLRQGDATAYLADYFDGAEQHVDSSSAFSRINVTPAYNVFQTVGNNMTMAHQLRGVMSYFSVQNGSVGQFSKDLQNAQYAMNAPLGQGDNRSTLNHLLGVKTLFTREDQVAKGAAIPYGYQVQRTVYPEKAVYGLSNGTGTQLVTTNLNVPLVYSQPQAVTPAQWHRLSAVDRERSLTQAAVVAETKGVRSADYQSPKRILKYQVKADTTQVIDSVNKTIRYRLGQAAAGQKAILNGKQKQTYGPNIANPKLKTNKLGKISQADVDKYGPLVKLDQNRSALAYVLGQNKRLVKRDRTANKTGLHLLSSDAQGKQLTYELTIDKPQRTKGTELYLQLDGISSHRESAREKVQSSANTAILGGQPRPAMTKINNWRSALLNQDMGSYWITVSANGATKNFTQLGIDNLSDYEPRTKALLNLGYAKKARKTIKITFHTTKAIKIKSAKLIAMPFNRNYDRQIRKLQRRGLTQQHVTDNQVTGRLATREASVLTTSIPYTPGWHLTVDGHPTKTMKVNEGFVGARLSAGNHRIKLTYRTPGLRWGIWLTVAGALLLVVAAVWHYVWRPIPHRH